MKKIISFMALHMCVVSMALGSSVEFCLKKCTEEFCGQSQENYQQCQDSCRGKYEGLIAKCKLVAKKEGYTDLSVNKDAKFTPCIPGQNGEPKPPVDGLNTSDSENIVSLNPKTDDEKQLVEPDLDEEDEAASDEADASHSPQDGDESDQDDSDNEESSAVQDEDLSDESSDESDADDESSEEAEA